MNRVDGLATEINTQNTPLDNPVKGLARLVSRAATDALRNLRETNELETGQYSLEIL